MEKSQKIAWVGAIAISLLLLFAALAKFFYPYEFFFVLDRLVGIFEVLFAIFLLIFFRRAQMWMAAFCLFSIWSGYAFFWLIKNLTCGCFGKLLLIPPWVSFSLDTACVAFSFFIIFSLKEAKKNVLGLLAASLIFALMGYYLAEWAYIQILKLN